MKKIVAVTTCPTGVAHTYMAAEALRKAAETLGVEIKVETQGALGVENELTEEEIKQADFVLIAAGKGVNKDRFGGKKVYEVNVSRALKEPDKIIEETLSIGNDMILKTETHAHTTHGKPQGIYKHLMSGVSFMIPVVVAGGILLAISFIWGLDSADVKSTSYNAIAAALNKIGGGDGALGLMVPVLAAGIAFSIADRAGITAGLMVGWIAKTVGAGFLGGILGGFLAGYVTLALMKYIKVPKSIESLKAIIIIPVLSVGISGLIMTFVIGTPGAALLTSLDDALKSLGTGNKILLGVITGCMMAFDMGGPLNKSIAVFAIGMIAQGIYEPFAAVMAGGVTPPLGLALATVIFKNKFTIEEREAGKSAWLLGASNITEGAIPFAVADPFRVIPCIMAGSAVSSTLSFVFNCGCKAPHGGLWATLIPNVITNAPLWVFSIACGMVVTALLLGVVKKDKVELHEMGKSTK